MMDEINEIAFGWFWNFEIVEVFEIMFPALSRMDERIW